MIISFIGAPCVGKGTIIKRVHEELLDQGRIGLVATSDIVRSILTDTDREKMKDGSLFPREPELRDALYEAIERQYALGAQAVLLDGFPRFDDQVIWLVQTFYDRPIQVFQVLVPSDFDIVRRAAARARDEFDTDRQKLTARIAYQRALLSGAERQIMQYGLKYSSVVNDHIDRAVLDVVGRIELPTE